MTGESYGRWRAQISIGDIQLAKGLVVLFPVANVVPDFVPILPPGSLVFA